MTLCGRQFVITHTQLTKTEKKWKKLYGGLWERVLLCSNSNAVIIRRAMMPEWAERERETMAGKYSDREQQSHGLTTNVWNESKLNPTKQFPLNEIRGRNFLGELSKQSCRFDEKKKNKNKKREKRILMKNGFSLFLVFFLYFSAQFYNRRLIYHVGIELHGWTVSHSSLFIRSSTPDRGKREI